ncbi:hypothetical protein AMOR_38950 [Anaeromyxobacter oryzae]|uniref:HEAT repeat domain-containing protein n=2 Tax=Anaeromyxobacter oryzae TaxID=2918170 RepID=A0ABM7WZI6_9BACT|nr:hypothetical protein AMOR_38950 [Anaeromyxobacter oryzae]
MAAWAMLAAWGGDAAADVPPNPSPNANPALVPAAPVPGPQAPDPTPPPPIATAADLGDFITGYYRSPRPDRLVEALVAADRLGVVGEGTLGPFSAFAGAVLREHPELIASGNRAMQGASTAGQVLWWQSVWTSGTPAALSALATAVGATAPVRDALEAMRAAPPPDPLLAAVGTPAQLDVLWASFFATGDGRVIVRIAAHLAWSEDADPQRRLVGEAARWSLRANAEAHPRVREVLEAAVAAGGEGADPARVRALLAEKGPPAAPPR